MKGKDNSSKTNTRPEIGKQGVSYDNNRKHRQI